MRRERKEGGEEKYPLELNYYVIVYTYHTTRKIVTRYFQSHLDLG
jgi:hypothetical protein